MKKRLQFITLAGAFMRFSFIQLGLVPLVLAHSYARTAMAQELLQQNISLSVKDTEIKVVLARLEAMVHAKFVYSSRTVSTKRKVSLKLDEKPLSEALEEVFKPNRISYKVVGGQIVINVEPTAAEMSLSRIDHLTGLSQTTADRPVTGTVKDEKGEVLPGVSIVLKGTTRGTSTDAAGTFRMDVPETNAVLIFSFVGYQSKELPVGNQSRIDIQLTADNKALDEVVVVGYGSQRKQDITSAVSVINLKDIGEQPANNMNQILQGRAPGVMVKQKTGAPGGQFEVRIRGISSLGAGSDPLYVIDGFAVGNSVGQNLNPNDIESISVLKDAASTAIYGARGSNGVVLITTKNAKEGKTNINFSLDRGIQSVPMSRRVKMLNGVEFAQFKKDVFMDQIRILQGREPAIDEVPIGYRYPEQTKYSTDWYDLIIRDNAPYTDANLTVSSGAGPIKALLSAGYYKEDGVIKQTDYDRISLRANLGGQVKKFLSVGLNMNGSYTRNNLANTDGRSALVGGALLMDPRATPYNADGSLVPYINGVDGVFGFPNPLYTLQNVIRRRSISDVLSNGFVEVSFLKNFKFRTSANIKLNNNTYKEFIPSTIGLPVASGTAGAPPRLATETDNTEELVNISADQLLTYSRDFNSNHHFDALVGMTAQRERVRGITGTGNTFPNDLVPFLGSAVIKSSNSYEYGWTMLAYLARANYSFKDKYLLSASFRREGSSRFGAQNRYGNFPAASVGWRLSEESFMPKPNWLTDLKLRGSWGVTGNNSYGINNSYGLTNTNTGNYASLAFMNTSNYILGNAIASGVVVGSFANTDLGWERSDQLDLGMDLSTFNNKLTFTLEYYNKITHDMLLPISIPSVSGFTTSLSNIGKVRNKGIEIGVDFRTQLGPVNFRTNGNITVNRSKVLEIKGANDALWYGSFYGGYNVQKVGRPIGMIYGYKKVGIFNTQAEIDGWAKQDGAIPGAMKFVDTNGDGVITYDTQDMVEIGNPNPAFTWAWTGAADYKRFDVNILFVGAQNFDVYRNIEASTMNMDGVFNVLDKAKDRWRSPENPGSNPNAKNSQGGTSYFKWSRESSERYVYDASYVWLKSITVGYTFPKFKSVLSDARIFVTGNNLFLFTKYPGNNPDAGVRGGTELNNDDESYPIPRTLAAGLKVNF